MESPGTAPGSEPRITGAFIAIVTVARDRFNIGTGLGRCKREGGVCFACFICAYGAPRDQQAGNHMKMPAQSLARAFPGQKLVAIRSRL